MIFGYWAAREAAKAQNARELAEKGRNLRLVRACEEPASAPGPASMAFPDWHREEARHALAIAGEMEKAGRPADADYWRDRAAAELREYAELTCLPPIKSQVEIDEEDGDAVLSFGSGLLLVFGLSIIAAGFLALQ